jgi:hypothetical protein
MGRFTFLDKFVEPFKKSVAPFTKRRSEQEIIAAVIERIHIAGEDAELRDNSDKEQEKEEMYGKLIRRLKRQIKNAGISSDEIIRSHNGPISAIMLLRYAEKYKQKQSTILKDRINQFGFKYLQNGVWILPPSKTPQNLNSQDDLRLWFYQNLTKPIGKDLQFVLPFVALIDLKKVFAERKRIRKKAWSKTIFNIMEMEEMIPTSYIYEYLKRRKMSIEDVLRSGDIHLLASAFADASVISQLEESKDEIIRRLQQATGANKVLLDHIANLEVVEMTNVLNGLVSHAKDIAQRMIVEARYWERFLEGEPGSPQDQDKESKV